eukprot:5838057-Amphidinium_carterae.2
MSQTPAACSSLLYKTLTHMQPSQCLLGRCNGAMRSMSVFPTTRGFQTHPVGNKCLQEEQVLGARGSEDVSISRAQTVSTHLMKAKGDIKLLLLLLSSLLLVCVAAVECCCLAGVAALAVACAGCCWIAKKIRHNCGPLRPFH